MAKGGRGQRRFGSRLCRQVPYPPLSLTQDFLDDLRPKKGSRTLDEKDWQDVTCSVCMECPHKAVLLLCSSHNKGCRPYMCGTSFRYSNCLDQYKKAHTKVISSGGTEQTQSLDSDSGWSDEKCEITELACPLCRGQVKGWTVVEPAREYLNAKRRSCMQDDCSFTGTYKELRKHMKMDHPSARPREVDPILEQKWRRLERERERDDVVSTIRSTMPGAMVFGDYVIERNSDGLDTDEEDLFSMNGTETDGPVDMGFNRNLLNMFLLLHAFGPAGTDLGLNRGNTDGSDVGILHTSNDDTLDSSYQDSYENDGMSLAIRLRRHGRMLLSRSGRRRRRREHYGQL